MDTTSERILRDIALETAKVGGWVATSECAEAVAENLASCGYLSSRPLSPDSSITVYVPTESGNALLRELAER
jgi:hypothetical protein